MRFIDLAVEYCILDNKVILVLRWSSLQFFGSWNWKLDWLYSVSTWQFVWCLICIHILILNCNILLANLCGSIILFKEIILIVIILHNTSTTSYWTLCILKIMICSIFIKWFQLEYWEIEWFFLFHKWYLSLRDILVIITRKLWQIALIELMIRIFNRVPKLLFIGCIVLSSWSLSILRSIH